MTAPLSDPPSRGSHEPRKASWLRAMATHVTRVWKWASPTPQRAADIWIPGDDCVAALTNLIDALPPCRRHRTRYRGANDEAAIAHHCRDLAMALRDLGFEIYHSFADAGVRITAVPANSGILSTVLEALAPSVAPGSWAQCGEDAETAIWKAEHVDVAGRRRARARARNGVG